MKISELIKQLKKLERQDWEIMICDNGYVCDGIKAVPANEVFYSSKEKKEYYLFIGELKGCVRTPDDFL